jgi:hypothetical protein
MFGNSGSRKAVGARRLRRFSERGSGGAAIILRAGDAELECA